MIDIDNFIKDPSSFKLFRGENLSNRKGLYFTFDEKWAKKFGSNMISGYLPKDAKVKEMTKQDLDEALGKGFVLEEEALNSIFEKGYDAIITVDSRNDDTNVIVNPKHIGLFLPCL